MKYCLFAAVFLIFIGFSSASQAGDDPILSLQMYMRALESGDFNNAAPYYSADSSKMMAGRQIPPAAMANEFQTLQSCGKGTNHKLGRRGVVTFPHGSGRCSPYFFVDEDGWKLDFITMSTVIRFDHQDQWWIDPAIQHPYDFAFKKNN